MIIDTHLVHQLIQQEFPQWADLSIEPIVPGGWDNRSFRLGNKMVVRLPSKAIYATNIQKEYHWLPILSPQLPLSIPKPIALGQPCELYPWHWCVYEWLPGETLAVSENINQKQLAIDLAEFLNILQSIDTKNGPVSGEHNFHRGGDLGVYAKQTQDALKLLNNKFNTNKLKDIWDKAISSHWEKLPVWVHGDVSAGNLLVQNSRLSAVIDFGGLCIGDPACDYAIAWTYFDKNNREIFKEKLNVDNHTWLRGAAWALWKALIIEAKIVDSNNVEKACAARVIEEVMG